ncbi:hypothetical protein C8F04DRAFT_1389103, partial [Mycena alexandri]
ALFKFITHCVCLLFHFFLDYIGLQQHYIFNIFLDDPSHCSGQRHPPRLLRCYSPRSDDAVIEDTSPCTRDSDSQTGKSVPP